MPFLRGSTTSLHREHPSLHSLTCVICTSSIKKWTMCQILEVLLPWIILWAISMLFCSECMPEKPITTKFSQSTFVLIEFKRQNSYWLRRKPLIIQKFVFMICFKGAPPFFSSIHSYLFNNFCSFCILHNEGGNNYMLLWWQLVLLLFLQMETATNFPANIYLWYASFSSLSAYLQ